VGAKLLIKAGLIAFSIVFVKILEPKKEFIVSVVSFAEI